MKRAAVVAVVILAGCASRSAFDCPDLAAAARSAAARTIRDAQGRVTASGRALERLPDVRTGAWTFWYENGAKRAEVTYALACYIQCCTGGPCPQVHDYPLGAFRAWYPSGRRLAEGTFVAVPRHVETSCQGGDDTKEGRLSKESRFWREDGSPMTLDEALGTLREWPQFRYSSIR